ncbi:MAG: pyridoxamine 5'-phosphate oxidase family protein [Ardenticatenaceae bacterium]|nr:pyridoxamine 5'-phosphate oxidase family protein [Ardenticatenaceae bacterium]
MPQPPTNVIGRLESERNIWVATIRPQNGNPHPTRPHLVPVWFAWQNDKLFICIQGNSVKAKNLRQNPHISLALEDGSSVVICEGEASEIAKPGDEGVRAIFQQKYDWDITTDHEYDLLLEIIPQKWLVW